jgi:hypothetical protein
MTSKLFVLSTIAILSSSAAFAQDSPSTTTETTKKESITKKVEHAPGAVVKDTKAGMRKVGHGTKKVELALDTAWAI